MGSLPETIGPYRIEGRLGRGGMGEVYRAWDERLERRVALKVVRPESAESATARERFRREARAAAGLSHSAIVQIYDILEWDGGDAIVMELVDGESLALRLARGPLPLPEAVHLGREIARGLAAAHARGIIHRDLKAENVMITEEGSAKILDFGLAKRLGTDLSLTEDHKVLGTFRSMSPEQARGLPLDARTDLFSLGVLLYEMLSGRSPFDGGAALETLTRICTRQQTPLRDVDPGIPEGLSNLIDHLLEKDPVRRPQSAREVARELDGLQGTAGEWTEDGGETLVGGPPLSPPASREEPRISQAAPRPARKRWALPVIALAVLALSMGALLVRLTRPKPLHVAVMKPEIVAAGEKEGVHRLAAGLRSAVLRGLTSLEGVYPLAPEQVDPVSGPPLRVAKLTAADEVVTSTLDCSGAVCQLSLARVGGRDGNVLWSQGIEVPVDKPYLMAEAVEGHLRRGYPDHKARGGALEVRPEDYAEYLTLLRRSEQSLQEELPPDALARLAAIRRSSPRFLEAFIFEAGALQKRFQFRRDAADLDRAAELLEEARDLAPADPRPLQGLFEVAMKAQRLDRARQVLGELERLQPGSYEVMTLRARLLEQEGKAEEAVDLIREVARRNPSWRHLFWAARMTYRNGHTEEGRRYLEDLLARFPEYPIGKSLLGEWELLTGSPERAVELYTDLVRHDPGTTDLVHLGLAYLLLSRYPEAEERFEQALAASPENPLIALNLADVLLLRGKKAEAESLYRQILSWIDQDPGALQVQLLSVRAQALAHLGRRREAAEAAQRMLRIAPDDPQVALDVSLVYTLVGDQASALLNAQRALEGGIEPRWFAFPWFAPLRSSPEFSELLEIQSAAATAAATKD